MEYTRTFGHNAEHPDMPLQSDLRDIFALFDELRTGIVLLDSEGAVLRVNALAEERLEESDTELLGRDLFREAFPVLEQAGVGAAYRQGIRRGSVAQEWEGELVTGRGQRQVWLGFGSFRFKNSAWGLVVVEDRAQLLAAELRRKQAERLAAVGELAAGIAHEVNNPLASIRSFAQLLAREAVSDEQRRALAIINDECMRIARAVENLLKFARQQGAGGRVPVNLSALVEQVLELHRYALDTAGIEVRKDLDTSLSPVMGEPGALQQVVLNLVVNAEQALASQPGERRLIVRTRESSEGIVLSVVDNGPGIPRDRLPFLFEPLRDDGPGAPGLGLGISATIVREHGGHILAESEEGRGAAFFVRLPRAGGEAATQQPAAPAPKVSAEPARRLRVLVADDEATLRLAIAMFLERRGHQVTQAADAHEALRLAQEREFDVALVDARMPGDGLALLEKLEAIPHLRGRTALMTGDLGRARTTQGITTGRPYLVKPFDMVEAVNLLEKLGQ